VLLLQRSPLVKLLPEARVISSSGFTEGLTAAVAVIGGLGAFDAVSGATTVTQVTPAPGSSVVNLTAGNFGTFTWQVVGFAGTLTASTWTISGQLPAGLIHADHKLSHSNFLSGVPVESGSFPVSITVWEDPFATTNMRSVSGDFTIVVAPPTAPAITAQPVGGNFTEGAFVSLLATQTSGFTFAWEKDGAPVVSDSTVIFGTNAPKRYRVHTSDPGTVWRSGAAFNDSAWTLINGGGIGYDTNPNPVNYAPHIGSGGDIRTQIAGRTAVHSRIPYTLTGNIAISGLKLRVQSDDGFVAWLNGTEVASQNRLGNLQWNSPAGHVASDSLAVTFREFDISRSVTLLRTGENLLAVQAMNESTTSSDLLFNCELTGGTDTPHTRRLIIPSALASDAGSYTLTITNSAGVVTSDPAVIVMPPAIEAHPLSVTIPSGGTAPLSVEPVISPPWTFQWFVGAQGDTSQPVPGATGPAFTTPPLTQTTTYWVRVSNAAGSADSNAATVTVTAANPPVISEPPQSVVIDAGTAAQLSVSVTGPEPFTYQWYLGDSGNTAAPVPGATGSIFITPPLLAPASYWVRVGNASGAVDSPAATVSIREPFQTWTRARFTAGEAADPLISGPAADPDGDGLTNEREYIFGTLPTLSDPTPVPTITINGDQFEVSFIAAKATGAGYDGRERHYAIESTTDPGVDPWNVSAAVSDVIGNDQTVVCIMPIGLQRSFCRLRVWLTP
jgi:hypothetical protein